MAAAAVGISRGCATLAQQQTELIEAHLELADVHAKVIYLRIRGRIPLDDLVQCGRLGLVKAAQRFDSARGFLFKTYAEYHIRGSILDGIRRETKTRKHRYRAPNCCSLEELLKGDRDCDRSRWIGYSQSHSAFEAQRDVAALTMRVPHTRANDRALRILAERANGETLEAIAAREGLHPTRVSQLATRGLRLLHAAA